MDDVKRLEQECERILAEIERNAGREPQHADLVAELRAAMDAHQAALDAQRAGDGMSVDDR